MMRKVMLIAVLAALLCVPAASHGEAPAATQRPIQLEDISMDVKKIQSQLMVLGYYSGNLSGHFGEATRAAVMEFQQDVGLPTTGEVDAATLTRMNKMKNRPLYYGVSGEAVTRLQTRLTYLSYYTGQIHGHYLESTEKAVREFQHKMGLPATGTADEYTLQVLYSSDARNRADEAVNAKAAAPTEAPVTEVLEVTDGDEDGTAAQPTPGPMPTSGYTSIIQKGATGERVKRVQQRLIDLMYYTGEVTGNYQNKTITAVKNFQQQNGLKATGKVDEDTWNALFMSGRAVPPDATPRPTSDPKAVPFAVTVDVANQIVTVYGRDENNEYTVVVKQMLCSSGTVKNPSSLGDWKLNGKTTRWCFFPKWGDYAQYWTRINASIAFHSVIYNTVSSMDLSVKSYNLIGSRASHGCIRLMVPDAKWVYENVGEGTIVSIRDHMPADPELKDALKTAPLNRSNMMPQATTAPTAKPAYVSGAMPPQPLRKLNKGSSGEDVYWLQRKLTELGFYTGSCTGTYLGGTADAVRRFQSSAGIRADGVATVETLEALYREELSTPAPYGTPAPTEAPTPESTPDPNATPTATPATTPAPAVTPTNSPVPPNEYGYVMPTYYRVPK